MQKSEISLRKVLQNRITFKSDGDVLSWYVKLTLHDNLVMCYTNEAHSSLSHGTGESNLYTATGTWRRRVTGNQSIVLV